MLYVAKIGLKHSVTGKYLLTQREDKLDIVYPNMWEALGGEIGPGKKPEEAILWKIKKEVGDILLGEVSFLDEVIINEEINKKIQQVKFAFFLGKTLVNLEDLKLKNAQGADYFTLDEMMELNTVPNFKDFLNIYWSKLEKY